MAEPEPILCYVDRHELYFTTQALDRQWGDDWNDAPWWCNAGMPYLPHGPRQVYTRDRGWHERSDYTDGVPNWHVFRAYWAGPFCNPTEDTGPPYYSVDDINRGEMPWLQSHAENSGEPCVKVMGGWPYEQVARAILEAGGVVSPLGDLVRERDALRA
jgi:hypothetical protein